MCAPCDLASQGIEQSGRFAFNPADGGTPIEAIHGGKAKLEGNYRYVPGVSGDALQFDGYTTLLRVPAAATPPPGSSGFTVEAWIALNTYPWNWIPIADQQKERQAGYFLGVDAFGHVSLEASINGQWQSCVSVQTLPLKRWSHVAGTYRTERGEGTLTVVINGSKVCDLDVHGEYSPAGADLLIGRVRKAVLPFPEAEVKPSFPIWYSLDGILDEVTFFSHGLRPQDIAQQYAAFKVPPGEVLPWQRMPSGPAGPGPFGAFHATLRYEDGWDRLRRTGDDSDVVVRFDTSPVRLVFWQGLNYAPAWVTGDDKWYTDEFLEVWNAGCPDGGDCEPMSDKQERFARVNILESNSVRAVVYWRYALVEAVNFKGAWPDERTGWFDWADEYWTVYPDGVAVRKQVLHSSNTHDVHEWQETIVLHQPGHSPEDDIHDDAITLENMQGKTKTYRWKPKADGAFTDPSGPPDNPGLSAPNVQLVNLKSMWKPFQIVPPEGVTADFYNNEKSYFEFECWNHWPVAQIASSDRPCVTNDRPSHSSLSHLFWNTYSETENTATKILIDGLTTGSPADLLPLARSWTSPALLKVEGNDGSAIYDPTQRAFVVVLSSPEARRSLHMTLQSSVANPAYHPALVLKNWGSNNVRLLVDGHKVHWGKVYRKALVQRLDETDLLLWMETESTKPVQLTLLATPSQTP